jgi:S-adenosylmethionine hydrolase
VQIADITHSISPQNIFQGALILSRTARFFPPGTIHVAVVDPGVGTDRRPICINLGDHFFIGPDNGLFSMVLDHAEQEKQPIHIIHINKSDFWLPEVSRAFHGRDIFAPVAAHLALGKSLEQLGSPIEDPVRLMIPHPKSISGGGWRGQVIDIDTFGNLSTNIEQSHLSPMYKVKVQVAGQQIEGLVDTFGNRPAGTLIALYGTNHDLVISVVNGNAAQYLNAKVGDIVEVYPATKDPET